MDSSRRIPVGPIDTRFERHRNVAQNPTQRFHQWASTTSHHMEWPSHLQRTLHAMAPRCVLVDHRQVSRVKALVA
jgi:hypothetical protein